MIAAEARGDDSLRPWADTLRSQVAEDMARLRPAVVMVAAPNAGIQALPRSFDIVAWLSQDPDFVGVRSAYRRDRTAGNFPVFRRQ